MRNNKTSYLTQSAAVAAIYVLLTMLAAAMGLSSGQIQVRFSEALTILPCFLPAAVPGLFIGCLIANLLSRQRNPQGASCDKRYHKSGVCRHWWGPPT